MPTLRKQPWLILEVKPVATLVLLGLGVHLAAAASPLSLPLLNGGSVQPLAPTKDHAVVLFFISHDCPISNSYAPEINRIYQAYGSKNVKFFAVYAEAETPIEIEREHARAFGFHFPAVRDSHFQLASQVGASVTPEAVVLSGRGKVLYRGRIDNVYASLGVRRMKATAHDLRDALDAILSGRTVSHSSTPALGCYIPKPV